MFPSGSVYEGEFRQEKRHGKGTYTFPDGRLYEGDWNDDKFCGSQKLPISTSQSCEKTKEEQERKKHQRITETYDKHCNTE